MLKITFLFILLSLSQVVLAETWVTNRDHSEIMFQVPYMGISEVTGRFNEFNAQVDLKDGQPLNSTLVVQISTASIDTGNKMRDGHLKGSDFLQAQQHPYITFKSESIKLIKLNVYISKGMLTIKGIAKPAIFKFTLSQSLKDTWGFDNHFVKFQSSINRNDYNIVWNKTLDGQKFLVGDVISIWGTFQIQPSRQATPNSKHMIPDTKEIRTRDQMRNESAFSKKLRSLINGK